MYSKVFFPSPKNFHLPKSLSPHHHQRLPPFWSDPPNSHGRCPNVVPHWPTWMSFSYQISWLLCEISMVKTIWMVPISMGHQYKLNRMGEFIGYRWCFWVSTIRTMGRKKVTNSTIEDLPSKPQLKQNRNASQGNISSNRHDNAYGDNGDTALPALSFCQLGYGFPFWDCCTILRHMATLDTVADVCSPAGSPIQE